MKRDVTIDTSILRQKSVSPEVKPPSTIATDSQQTGFQTSHATTLVDYRSNTDDNSFHEVDIEWSSQARSTLADALRCSTRTAEFVCPEDSSDASTMPPVSEDKGHVPLSSTSGAIIKHCFSETTPLSLPQKTSCSRVQ